jgi:hypothetical protein
MLENKKQTKLTASSVAAFSPLEVTTFNKISINHSPSLTSFLLSFFLFVHLISHINPSSPCLGGLSVSFGRAYPIDTVLSAILNPLVAAVVASSGVSKATKANILPANKTGLITHPSSNHNINI